MKLSHTFHQGMQGVKGFLQRGYRSAKGFAEGLDTAVGAARKTDGIRSPILDSYLGSSHGESVKMALEGYEELKSRAVHAHGQGGRRISKFALRYPNSNLARIKLNDRACV